MLTDDAPILVTGAHRSGTTWVGKMLALAPHTGYVHEPFSPITRPGVSAAPFDHWFTYVTPEDEQRYLPFLRRTIAFRYDWRAQLRATRDGRDALRAVRDAAGFTAARVRRARAVVKDPIALLSAPWLAERLGMRVLVLVRHPAAFAGSLRRRGMTFRFETFLNDERLLAERLGPFADEIRAQVREPGDFVAQASLLWRILYGVVDEYRSEHPDWLFVRHEDLAADPVPGFARMYAELGLELTAQARQRIAEHSTATLRADDARAHDVRLDSRSTLRSWRTRLSPEELDRLHDAVADVAGRFYSEEDWS